MRTFMVSFFFRKIPVFFLKLCFLTLKCFSAETREKALLELSQKREHVDNLAPMLWHSFGTISALLQEIVSVYFAIDPPTLSGMVLILN